MIWVSLPGYEETNKVSRRTPLAVTKKRIKSHVRRSTPRHSISPFKCSSAVSFEASFHTSAGLPAVSRLIA